MEMVFLCTDNANVVGGLYRAFQPFAHLDDTVWNSGNGADQGDDRFTVDEGLWLCALLYTFGG